MEGSFHGPNICTLEDCKEWFYTGCQSAGIAPTTCVVTPPVKPTPPPPPPTPPKKSTPVGPLVPIPPIPPPEDPWSILPGLAREEQIETKQLEEEAKRPKQQEIQQAESPYDKRQAALESMLSTQPIRDELNRDAETQSREQNQLFRVQWEEDRKMKMEQLIKRQERQDRAAMRMQFSTGATGVGDFGDRGPTPAEIDATGSVTGGATGSVTGGATGGVAGGATGGATGGVTGATGGVTGATGSGATGSGSTDGAGSVAATGATGATGGMTGKEGATGGVTGSATGDATGGETGATGMTGQEVAYTDPLASLDDATHYRKWLRNLPKGNERSGSSSQATQFHADNGHESSASYLARWQRGKRQADATTPFTTEDLADRSMTTWQQQLKREEKE